MATIYVGKRLLKDITIVTQLLFFLDDVFNFQVSYGITDLKRPR
jgi:hypothetical protein